MDLQVDDDGPTPQLPGRLPIVQPLKAPASPSCVTHSLVSKSMATVCQKQVPTAVRKKHRPLQGAKHNLNLQLCIETAYLTQTFQEVLL